MNNHFIAIILAVITAIAASVTSTAQASIDRLVNEFEKDKSVEVTYSEHRNPKTKKNNQTEHCPCRPLKFTGGKTLESF